MELSDLKILMERIYDLCINHGYDKLEALNKAEVDLKKELYGYCLNKTFSEWI